MGAAAAHSLAVGDTSESGHPIDDDKAQRGAALRGHREAAAMTFVDVYEATGISRQTVAKAERGVASVSETTYRALENFFENEISGPPRGADAGLIEFTVEGDLGVRVVVRGPIGNAEDLERSVARIVDRIRNSRKDAD